MDRQPGISRNGPAFLGRKAAWSEDRGLSWPKLGKHHHSLLMSYVDQTPFAEGQGLSFHVLLCFSLSTHSLPQMKPTSHFPFFPLAQIIASHGNLNIVPGLFSRCGDLAIQPRDFPDFFPTASLLLLSFLLLSHLISSLSALVLCLPGSSGLSCFPSSKENSRRKI